MLRLAPAERVSVVVEMNNPGVWVLGEVRKHVRAAGMGIVVEYAQRSGEPQWQQPTQLAWNYEQFGTGAAADPDAGPATVVPLVFAAKFRGHGAMEAWTINGKSFPDTSVAPWHAGERYILKLVNASADDHPVHLHRHTFQLRGSGRPLGVMKDVVLVDAHTTREVELIADNPGPSLFHCHQQNHMDLGFMMLVNYA
jgi:FtsP/CotA-like multicopper oxidase with cupredoxin domain